MKKFAALLSAVALSATVMAAQTKAEAEQTVAPTGSQIVETAELPASAASAAQ